MHHQWRHPMTVPLLVTISTDATATAIRRLTREGWCVQRGLTLPREPWDVTSRKLVVSGTVSDQQGLAVTVSSAARGAGVIAHCTDSGLATAMEAALCKVGPVRRELDITAEYGGLTREQSALLARLAAGESVAAAAEAEFLSLRTANRRLAQARDLLGVTTTGEAIQAYIALTMGSALQGGL